MPRSFTMKKHLTLSAALLTVGALCLGASPGVADDLDHGGHWGRPGVPTPGEQTVLAEGLVTPLALALGRGRSFDVAQESAGLISRVRQGQATTLDALDPLPVPPPPGTPEGSVGEDVADAVSRFDGTTYYALTRQAGLDNSPTNVALLKSIDRDGEIRTITDLAVYEREANPDGVNHYGLQDLDPVADKACIAASAALGPRASYTGGRDSHPYATLATWNRTYVADAGANAILSVDRWGNTSTVAVLPPVSVTVDAELLAALGDMLPPGADLSPCLGKTYNFEPVPTDVEMGWDGSLYVTTLGSPNPFLGPLGKVYRINSWNGDVSEVASGFTLPTGLALDRHGNIYVAELFEGITKDPATAGQISVIPRWTGERQEWLKIHLPGAVEVRGNALYVTKDVLPIPPNPNDPPLDPDGKVVRIQLDRSWDGSWDGGHGGWHSGDEPNGDTTDENDD
jgi:hypothetical protein